MGTQLGDRVRVAPTEDIEPIAHAPWLTPRRLMLFVIGWLALFALMSVFISNPFQSETSASAAADYARVMFLHGLLIGLVGLLAMLTCQILALTWRHALVWITGGVLFATILSAVGGIFDTKIPGAEIPMWVQIFSFFALDEILIVLLIGVAVEWSRNTQRTARSLPFLAAFVATIAMLGAAVMGHLAGWIEEFGWNTPSLLERFAKFAGYGGQDDWVGSLVGSHSHEMVVGVMALTIVLVAWQFGYTRLSGAARTVARLGVAMVAAGSLVMSGMYLFAGFSSWSPPPWFVSGPGGANGIASDDIITGVLVMGGGVVVAVALLMGRLSILRQPVRLAALWCWVLSFATVVIAGYAIELNTIHFGAGDPTAPGAANDAIYTWLHQDIGLFLLPALVLVMLAVERLVKLGHPAWIGWMTIAGASVTFIGGMVFVFVSTSTHGLGYAITTTGLAIIGVALLATLWWGIATARQTLMTPAAMTLPPPPQKPAPIQEPARELVAESR